MTEPRQRGVGVYQRTDRQEHDAIDWMTTDHLDRRINDLTRELNAARHDFTNDLPWFPMNHYRLCDWWENLARLYDMRRRRELLRGKKALR